MCMSAALVQLSKSVASEPGVRWFGACRLASTWRSSALGLARTEVIAKRAIFVHRPMGVVDKSRPKLKNRPMASYTLEFLVNARRS